MNRELAAYSERNWSSKSVELFETDLGPFCAVKYTTQDIDGAPAEQNSLLWLTIAPTLDAVEPERIIEVGETIVEVRNAVENLGYQFVPIYSLDGERYTAVSAKETDVDQLANELRQIRDQFANWKA